MKTRKLTLLAMTMAVAMILSYVESQLPPLFAAIPGIKMGLANIAVVFALYKLGWREAVLVSLLRVLLVSLLFSAWGLMGLFYSLAGACLSLLGMIGLKALSRFSSVAVSVAGGVLHNIGQIAMASLLMQTDVLRYYLPYLILSGTLAGVLIGVLAAILVKRIPLKTEE